MQPKGISLRVLRKQANRTQKEMAELLGVALNTWQRWEKEPDSMPYKAHEQAIDFLERSVQLRKEAIMGKVVIDWPEEDENPEEGWTVPAPEGWSTEFHPSQPVTIEQMLKYERTGKEPYPGYGDEYAAWEKAGEERQYQQMLADGAPTNIQEVVHVDPEFDEYGEPVEYAHEPKVVVRDNGDVTFVDSDDIIADNTAHNE